MDERQPEALMRRIHEEMVQADLFEIAMISRLSKRLLKIRKPKATEKSPWTEPRSRLPAPSAFATGGADMKLVKINSETSVAPDQIAMLKVDTYGRGLNVNLKDGTSIWVDCDYGKTAYETKSALERQINEALA